MSIQCTHDAWRGNHTTFMAWRRKLAEAAELPPLDLMEGFYVSLAPYNYGSPPSLANIADKETAERLRVLEPCLPIQWSCLRPDALHELLYVSWSRGDIPADRCGALADRLETLLPKMPEGDGSGRLASVESRNWREKTRTFIDGLRRASVAGESLIFG